MSSSRAVALALVTVVTLASAACGFRPLYGSGGGGEDAAVVDRLAAVDVGIIPDRRGQLLRNHLMDLLDPARSSVTDAYRLEVTLTKDETDVAVESTGFATRTNVRMAAAFRLVDTATGRTVLSDRTRVVSSYNIIDNKFSTLVAGNDAEERAVREIAYDIRRRLAVYFAQSPVDTAGAAGKG